MKNMKKTILISVWFLLLALNAQGQELSYSYDYDAAGNRIGTTVVIIDFGRGGSALEDATPAPLTDLRPDGETILVYPNPTQGTVTIERQDGRTIGDYRLADAAGRTLERGTRGERRMTLDLSGHANGVYLFEFSGERGTIHYKIIKQ